MLFLLARLWLSVKRGYSRIGQSTQGKEVLVGPWSSNVASSEVVCSMAFL